MTRDTPPDIDQLRARLRALGYLDARVDRYVLGSATARGGRTRFAIAAGLRVGVAAGALVGVSAAVALAARAPGLITGPRDALVVGLTLVVLFTLAAAAAVSVTVLAASWYVARGRRVTPARARHAATAAGVLVALAAAAYLTLWWGAAQAAFTALPVYWHAAAVAIAAATALLLAHAVSVVILAALARAGGDEIHAGGLFSSRAFLAVFGVLLAAGAAALAATGTPDAPRAAPSIAPAPTGLALRVVAIDGFDAGVSRRLAAEGTLPALSRLLAGAAVPLGTTDASGPDPARDWTTIATGQPASRHGITSLAARRARGLEGRLPDARGAGMQALVNAADLLRLTTPAVTSGSERRDPAFWEVAEAAGLRTAVINWWATWPAPAGDSIVITDRALLRLDTGGTLDAEVTPTSLYDALVREWPALKADARARARGLFAGVSDEPVREILTRSAEIDLLVAAIAGALQGPPLDALVVYLPGLDIAQHQLLQEGAPGGVSAVSARVAALEQYYRVLDGIVARLLPPAPGVVDAALLWPGRVASGSGTMYLRGGPIEAGVTACDDCAPGAAATLLYLLGLPLADDLSSTLAAEVIDEAFRAAHPVRRVSDYGAVRLDRRTDSGAGGTLDAEALERLRSLGYIR